MSSKGLGMTAIIASDGTLAGIYTDGDLRRTLDQGINIATTPIKDVMSTNCKTLHPHTLAVEALNLMDDNAINAIVVVDNDNKPVGAINMHSLLRAGVI